MKHSIFLARFLVVFGFFAFCSLWCGPRPRAFAAVSAEGVGRVYSETENGLAVVGVLVTLNGQRVGYAYDVWKYHAGSGWCFQYGKLNDDVFEHQDTQMGEGRYIAFMEPSGANRRVLLLGAGLRKYVEEAAPGGCYQIETVRFRKGEEISRECEYSDGSAADCVSPEYSLMLAIRQGSNVRYGGCTAEEISVQYNIYTGLHMGEGKEIAVNTDGGTVTRDGAAYRYKNSASYRVHVLPEAVRPQDEYRYELAGWYTEKEGGSEVTVGSLVSKTTRLYARWKKIPVKYPVTCRDVIQTGEKQTVLGMNTGEASFGESVSGADFGDNGQIGEYYPGRRYVGCSRAVVDAEGALVYRYFENAPMTVTCIDTVTAGPDTGQQLGNTTWDAAYASVVSGGSLGCSGQAGAYYRGYRYISSSTRKVEAQGCTVYRYFVPVQYNILFSSNCTFGGVMSPIQNCYYGHGYTLTRNSFLKRNKICLELNAEDAVCDSSYQYAYQDFAGWSDTPDGGVLYSDGSVVSNLCHRGGDVILYAVWSEREITVTAQPRRPGYEFVGWSLDPGDKKGRRQFLIDREETLYAIWKPAPVSYHVEYYKQNLDQRFELSAQYEFSGATGAEVNLEDCRDIYPGFFLDEAASRLKGTVTADGSLVLSVYFRRGEYRLDFDKNGGETPDDAEKLSASRAVFETAVTIPDTKLRRAGYEFGGWSLNKTGEHIVARPGEKFLIPNHDQTLYAAWIPDRDTPFVLIPYYQNTSGKGYIRGEEVMLRGTTGDTVRQGICANYSGSLERGIRQLFGEGCTLADETELTETVIRGDGSTCVEIYLKGAGNGAAVPAPDLPKEPAEQPAPPASLAPPVKEPEQQDNTAQPGTTNDREENGQVSVISTWIGATPDPGAVSAVLAKNAAGKLPGKGSIIVKKGIVYQITRSGSQDRAVRVVGLKKSLTRLAVPDSISVRGYSYRVTTIKNKAFARQRRLKKVVLGKNIQTIGRKAFYSCKKLRRIVVDSTDIRSIGKNAWKGIDGRCRIRFGKTCSILCRRRVMKQYSQRR